MAPKWVARPPLATAWGLTFAMALMAWSMPPDMVPMYSSHTRPPSPSSARVIDASQPYARATASSEATVSAEDDETPAPAGTRPSTMSISELGTTPAARPLAAATSHAPL